MQSKRSISRRDILTWAAGPEEPQSMKVLPSCLSMRGVSCRSCEDACLEGAIRFRPKLGGAIEPEIDQEACTLCKDCMTVCPVSALSLPEGAAS